MTTFNKPEIVRSLNDMGLSEQEADIYLSLLAIGGGSAIAVTKEAGIKRTSTYAILERLISKGVAQAYEKGSRKIYVALQPSKLRNLYENRLESILKIIPSLEKMKGIGSKEYGVNFIQSKKELERFYDGILNEFAGGEYYIIGSATSFLNIDRQFLLEFRKRRAARKIRTKLLLSHDSTEEEGQDDNSLMREFKYLPKKYKFKSTIDIYENKIVIIGPEVNALAAVIAIPPMVDVFRSIFEMLWDFCE